MYIPAQAEAVLLQAPYSTLKFTSTTPFRCFTELPPTIIFAICADRSAAFHFLSSQSLKIKLFLIVRHVRFRGSKVANYRFIS